MNRWNVDIQTTAPGDAALLAAGLRAADRAEVRAFGYPDALHAIKLSIDTSKWAHSVFDEDGLVCIVGLSQGGTVLAPYGVPWMLGTDLVRRHRRALTCAAREYTSAMLRDTPRLLNVVHCANTVSVRWLARVGFTLHPAQLHPKTGELCQFFEMVR